MVNKIRKLFASPEGKKIYATIEKAIFEHNMLEQMRRGVLVGFSGGADSVLLLSFLYEMKSKGEQFPILACHINHMIRGDEADWDECFSTKFAKSLDIEFVSYHIDVPKMAEERSIGIEEAARNARYSKFSDIIKGRNDIDSICVAHNATDNAETILFNIIRGTGTKGAAGIPPVRDNILRPLIYLPKKEITTVLDSFDIPYVVDS
jgi:tRNA(Ile)-lysidine synthase